MVICRMSVISSVCLQAVEISEASPAWQEYVDYIDAIVLNGLKQSSLTSLQSMLKQIVTSNMNQVGHILFFGLSPIGVRHIELSISTFSGLVLLLSLLYLYNITPPQFWSFCLSVSINFHLPCSHYIFFSVYLHTAQPSQSHFSYFLTYVCHTCPCYYFFIPDLLNPLYPIIHLNSLISVVSGTFCSGR